MNKNSQKFFFNLKHFIIFFDSLTFLMINSKMYFYASKQNVFKILMLYLKYRNFDNVKISCFLTKNMILKTF